MLLKFRTQYCARSFASLHLKFCISWNNLSLAAIKSTANQGADSGKAACPFCRNALQFAADLSALNKLSDKQGREVNLLQLAIKNHVPSPGKICKILKWRFYVTCSINN